MDLQLTSQIDVLNFVTTIFSLYIEMAYLHSDPPCVSSIVVAKESEFLSTRIL